MKYVFWLLTGIFIGGCSSTSSHRVVLDSSGDKPNWVDGSKLTWNEGDKVYFKVMHQVRGNERLNGCYDLAKLDAGENIMTEVAADLKGSIDNAQQSISEDAEVVLGKVRTSEYKGRLTGLKVTEQYFVRYRIDQDPDRIDCFVKAEISQTDYDTVKKSVLDRIVAVDPKLKEAITAKQINFFSPEKASSN